MALGAVLFSVLFFSLYLPFSSAAAQRFPDPDELAGFFGVFFGLSTGLAFVLSLVVTNRLLARFGVPTVLIVLPVLYLVGFGVLTVRDTFLVLAVTRFAQVAWLQGGAVSAVEAVTNTAPADRRDQARAFLYGGPTQLGTIVAGALAIAGRSWSPTTGFAIATACALAATVAMVAVRRRYPQELVRALREGRPSVFRRGPDAGDPFGLARDDRSAVDAARAALTDDDPRLRRVGAQVVADLDTPDATAMLLDAVRDDDADVRAIAIASLGRHGSSRDLPAVAPCLDDPDPRVRAAAVLAIGALSEDPTAAVARTTRDPDPVVRARAAGVVARRAPHDEATALLLTLAADPHAEVRLAAYEGMFGAGDARVTDAELRGLSDPDPRVRAAAARALDVTPDVTGRLLAALSDPAAREGALVALETHRPPGVQEQVGGAAVAMAEHAVERRAQAAAFAGTLEPRARLLADSLDVVADREARAAVRTAAALGGGADVAVALDNLADGRGRADAIEVLETIGDPRIVRSLLAVWEGVPSKDTEASAVLARLASDDDAWIRSCARFAAGTTDPTAGDAETMGETAATLSPMERVLFLRDVPLFAGSPPADLLPIASIVEERSFLDGDLIAARDEPGDEMYIVVSGSVTVSVEGDPGPIATRGPGDAIGEMALLTGRPRVADLRADGDVRALAIGRPQLEAILRERPEIALGVIRVLCDRLEESGARGERPLDAG
jgi:HEAT repeat protein